MDLAPNQLEKYFQSPNTLTEDDSYYYEANKYLLEQMQCGTKQDVVPTRIVGDFRSRYIPVSESNCDYTFTYNCWSNLKDDEKARIIFTLMHKTMHDKFPNISTPQLHFIISKELAHQKADAMCYQKKNSKEQDFVYIDPKYLGNSNGLTVVSLLTHELQHHNDFTMCQEKLLPHFIETYLPPNIPDFMHKEHIMKLDVSGQLYNYKTQSYDPITPQLQEQILMLKHKIHPLTSNSNIHHFSQVKNPRDMLQFMEFHAYTNTPLESRAYATGLECAQQTYDRCVAYGIKLEPSDQSNMQKIREHVENSRASAEIITRTTGKSMEYICNLFHERQYIMSRRFTMSAKHKERLSLINTELQELANCFTLESQSSM